MTDQTTALDSIGLTLQRWSDAERDGDTAGLDALLADDFVAVGPLGFTLTRTGWLDRHRDRALTYARFDLDELSVRRYDGFAVALARQDVQGDWQGHPVPAALRTTVVLTPGDGGWRLAAAHMSFVAGTAGSPPIPGRR